MAITTTSYDPNKSKPQQQMSATSTSTQPQYKATDYSQVQQPTFTQTAKPGNTVSYGDVANQINRAKNTQNQAQYQSPDWYAQAAQSNYQAMNPLRQQMNTSTNANYNQSSRQLSELLAAKGLDRSGTNVAQTIGLQQGRNAQLGSNNANILQQAIAQTLPQAQLGLSERGFLYGQQADAANMLGSLLGQQTQHQQFADQFNNQWGQQGYQNALSQLGMQNQENQWASQFGEGQRQFDTGQGNWQQQFDTGNNQWQQQFDNTQGQQDYANQAQLLQTLLNYNLGIGQTTDDMPMPSGFNYGDSMTQLLKQMGYL